MGKSKWKDDPVGLIFDCGCKEQIRKSTPKKGQPAARIKKCATHAPPEPEPKDKYNGVPDSALYWW